MNILGSKSDKSGFIKEGKAMDKEWERLYEEAMSVLTPHDVSKKNVGRKCGICRTHKKR